MKTATLFEIPGAVEFGYCRIGTQETRAFTAVNNSNVASKFAIFSEVFTFSPRQGERCIRYG